MQYRNSIKSGDSKFLLGWFVLASVFAHLFFISLSDNKNEQPVTINLSTPLQITVVTSRQKTSSTHSRLMKTEHVKETTPELKQASAQLKKTGTIPKVKQELITDTKSKISLINEPPVSTPEATTVINPPLNYLRQQLKQAIRARFTYPRMARRMGWEGLVGISLHIDNDGSLNQIEIARSSGHKILDENARKTIESIGRIRVVSASLVIQARDTEIEVLYRLTD